KLTSNCNLYINHFFINDTATTEIYTLSLHDALPIYTFTFNDIDSHCSSIEKYVDDIIIEQIYFIYVKNTPICIGKYTRFEAPLTLSQRVFKIECADNAIF